MSAASEPVRTFVERVAKLLETTTAQKDCAQLNEINSRSFTRFSCPSDKSLRKSMASFEVVDAQEYGSGAVVDYKSGEVKDGAAIVLFVAPDRTWAIGRFGVVTKPSVGTSDEDSRAGYDKAVADYLKAIRNRDCAGYFRTSFHGDKSRKDVCKTSFPATDDVAKRLKDNPSAKPEYQGGNAIYGFYSLETRKPALGNSTISVIKAGVGASAKYLVLDMGPSPTSVEQREAREQYKKRLKEGSGGMSGPSKDAKPSEPAVKP